MKWNKYRLETLTDCEDIVSGILGDLGINGVEIEDKVPLTESEIAQMFVDIAPVMGEDDGKAYVSFYLDEDDDCEAVLAQVRQELAEMAEFMDLGTCEITESQTEDEDWINNWKQYFHQFCIDDVLIMPSWEDVEPEYSDKLLIQIDPGTAFGTGKHETTRSCIRALKQVIKGGEEVLDVGTGSGILMMLALKFGALHGVGTDLDPCAEPAVEHNMAVNNIEKSQYDLYLGNVITDDALCETIGKKRFDVVVANILADVLIPLTPVVTEFLKPGGYYITSGIIDFKEEEVKAAMIAAGMEIVDVIHDGEWVCIISLYR